MSQGSATYPQSFLRSQVILFFFLEILIVINMKKGILLLVVLSCFMGSTSGQDLSFPELSGFRRLTNYPVYTRDNLWDFINGAADNYLAYGFEDLHVAEYRKGKNTIKLEIYRHQDNTMAFGIYSSERSSSFEFLRLGAQGYRTGGSINFFRGNYYVKIRTFSKKENILKSVESLAARVSSSLPGETAMPDALAMFPEAGLKKNEEIFVNESVLGHEFLNKAFRAAYEVGPDNFSIYIFRGNPSGITQTAMTYIKACGMEAGEGPEGKYVLADGYNGTVFLGWKEGQMVLVTGLASDQAEIAESYISEILK